MNPDRLAELEEERRFLLASIRDLDRELAAGDVDAADHSTLRDGYVARAAAVMREIEDGRNRLPQRAARPWWRRLVVPVATLAVGGLLGWAVAANAGQRLPGQSATGGAPVDEVAALLSEASQLMGTDLVEALKKYDEVLALEPDNVEALTYHAWVRVVAGATEGDQEILAGGLEDLQVAAEADATYPDPVCLMAVALARFVQPPDTEGALAAAQQCMELNPPADMAGLVEPLLRELELAAG